VVEKFSGCCIVFALSVTLEPPGWLWSGVLVHRSNPLSILCILGEFLLLVLRVVSLIPLFLLVEGRNSPWLFYLMR